MSKDKRILSSSNISKFSKLKKKAWKENNIKLYIYYGNMLYDHEKAMKEQQMKKRRIKLIGKSVLGKKIYKKIFGNVLYKLDSTHPKKAIAKTTGNKLKKAGYNIRIVKGGTGYSVYKHKK